MLIMISSSATNLYKKDVLRALSYPENTILQFRYDLRWIENIQDVNKGMSVLICYLDIKDFTIVPIRKANVQSIDKHGDLYFIKLCLKDYPTVSVNIRDLVHEKKSLLLSKDNKDGKFVFNVNKEIASTNDTKAWFDIVQKIYNCPDMQNINFFYRIFPLKDISGKLAEYDSKEALYTLNPDKEYNFEVLNYHPQKKGNGEGKIIIDKTFMSRTSTADIEVDSRYDLSVLRIRTAKSYYTDKYGYYRISCILNDDFIVTNTFNIRIKNNFFLKIRNLFN